MLLGGDFRQILPVLPKKGREDIVMTSINKSYLWNECTVFRLQKNMRLESGVPPVTISGQKISYADWEIVVGDGKVPTSNLIERNEPYWIQIPPELYLDPKDDGKKVVIDKVYRDLHNMCGDAGSFKNRPY